MAIIPATLAKTIYMTLRGPNTHSKAEFDCSCFYQLSASAMFLGVN